MAGHALRGAAVAGLVLITVETLARSTNGNVGGFFSTANNLVQRAFSPTVPLIPDRRAGSSGPQASQLGYITPAQSALAANAAANEPAVSAVLSPSGGLGGLTALQQYAGGGGLPAGIDNPNLYVPVPAPARAPGRYAN